ncbi:MAG: type II toxin-antitoxin system RelE/ParE family toxin [Methanoregula sp.]|jgi:mRNA interferase RelE/StbE|nr:type II toxin-antitoxin system RelE/ParE family toxin [Methanoregula sp.]MDD5187607.1 type II toxin-antitoxin system RelE/ParE family toxin [Methanoregula sp.]
MRLYTIQYTPRAERDLSRLPPEIAKKVVLAIHEIREAPYFSLKKLKVSDPRHPIFSFRIGRGVRVLVSIHDEVLIIHVLEVEHRKHSYRDF